jgi:hypothetical protein
MTRRTFENPPRRLGTDQTDRPSCVGRKGCAGRTACDDCTGCGSYDSRNGRRRARLWLLALVLAATASAAARAGELGTCVQPPANLVSWWAAEGNADDETGTNPGDASAAGFAPGPVGVAFTFDGDNEFVSVPDDPSLNLAAFTLEGWIESAELLSPAVGFIAVKSGSDGLEGYEFGVFNATGQLRLSLNGALGGADLIAGPDVIDGQLHHVAASYDGARLRLYVDGGLVGCLADSETVQYGVASPFYIGRRPELTFDGDWNGLIDELSLYSRALCATEIAAIHAAGGSGKCNGGTIATCELFADRFESGNLCPWSASAP